ncbi:NACHT domain-containing protein [Streptomyces antimycoticus]|uniref:NACHT domain-containing protein n=2 Tax=Streptomyces antimycoticus TaxID=68175 RepID=UPI0036E0E021
MAGDKGLSIGRAGLLGLGVGAPLVVGTQLWPKVESHPVLAMGLLCAYEVALAVLAFFASISKELENRLAKRVADGVERLLLARLTRYERRYRRYLVVRHSAGGVKGLTIQGPRNPRLDDVFVDVSLRPSPLHHAQNVTLADVEQEFPDGERRSLQDLLDDPGPRSLVVIGAPGTGKTTLLEHTTVVHARRKARRRAKRWLPVFITLRDHVEQMAGDGVAGAGLTIADVARLTLSAAALGEAPAGWFEDHLEHGRCVVLLDGLDEVADPYMRQRLVQWAESQVARYPDNHWVLTTRPQGYDAAPLDSAEVLVVRRFTPDQIRRFVHGWYGAVERLSGSRDTGAVAYASAEDLIDRLRAQPSLYGLSSNPLLLTMLCNVHRYLGALPGTRAELYGQICQVLLWRRHQAKGLWKDADAGPAREAVLRELAYGMMVHQTRSLPVGGALATDLLVPALVRELPGVSTDAFLTSVARTGLLVEREPGQFSFAHQTFQEYLAASHIHHNGMGHLLEGRISDAWWRESILLWSTVNPPDHVIEACLELDTAEALALAFDCYDEAREKPHELGQRLEQLRLEALQSPADSPRRQIMEGATVARHLRQVVWLADGVLVSALPVSHDVYRLFTDAHPEFRLEGSGGERGARRSRAATTNYSPAFLGIPPGAPEALVRWVNDVLDGSAAFRLPTWNEASDPAMQPLLPPECSLWCQPPRDWSDREPVCWAPEGMSHPWSVPLERVYERAVRSGIGAIHSSDASIVFPDQHTDPSFYSLFTDTAFAVTDTGHVFSPLMTFDSINISSSQALVRPSSPQLLVELLTSLPDVVERAPRLISPIHGDRSITEVRRLATSIAALGTETVARGVESEPEAADLLRAAAMFLADRSDGIEIETMCRDIALGITTLQDVESPCHSAVRGLRVRVAWPSGAHQEDHLACWDDAVRAGRAGSRAAHSRRVLAGLRTVAIDGTSLHLPDSEPIASRHTKRKRKGEDVEFGYPLLRLLTLIECGTRAVLAAAFGPETTGETNYAEPMLDRLTRGMLVLLDTGFDGYPSCSSSAPPERSSCAGPAPVASR